MVGGIAGIIFVQILTPWLAGFWPFSQVPWICNTKEGTTIINRTDKVYLTEDLAYLESIGKLANSVAAVRGEQEKNILTEGTGFILTGDGYLVTSNSLAPKSASKIVVIMNGNEYDAQVAKRNEQNNLALLKISENNLPAVSFGDLSSLKLGELVFLLGADSKEAETEFFTNIGYIKDFSPEISVSMEESQLANGSPLSNNKGDVMGLCLIDKGGKIKLVTSDKIRELLKQ